MMPCPDDETLAGFLEQRLQPSDHDAVAAHLAGCPSCLDVVAVAGATAVPEDEAVENPRRDTDTPDAAPTRPRARWPRALAAGLALLATGSLGYLATGGVAERARLAAVRVASARLGIPVDIAKIELALPRDLRAIGVRLLELELGPLGRVAAVEIGLAPGSLALGAPVLRHLRLFAPELRWTPSETDHGLTRPGGALGALALAPLVEVVDATLRVEQVAGPPIVIQHLSGTARAVGERIRVHATATLAGGSLGMRGTVDAGERPRLDLTIGGRDLPAASLPVLRDWAAGRTALALRIRGSTTRLQWAGRLHVADARLADVDPRRHLAAAVHVAPDQLAPATAADLRFTFRRDHTGWRVPRSVIVQGPLETRATLWSPNGRDLTGSGIARLAAAGAPALHAAGPYVTATGALAIPFRLEGAPGQVALVPGR